MLEFVSPLLRVCAALALVLAIGCASQQDAPPSSNSIPFPNKEAAWVTAKSTPGYPPYAHSPGQSGFFDELRLSSDPGDLAWGMYRLNPGTPQPAVLDVTVTQADPSDGEHRAWIGLANFATGRWDFSGPYAATQTIPASQDQVSPQGNVFVVVVTYDYNTAYIAEVSLGLDVAGELPYAALYCEYPSVDVQYSTSLDASGSAAAPGRTLTNFEWDLDGDGVFSEAGTEAAAEGNTGASAFGSDVSGQPGKYLVQVRVTDDLAQTSTASTEITFTGSLIVPVDAGFGTKTGEHVSLAVIDGRPAMGYYESTSGDLRYALSSTATGSQALDWTWIAIDTANDSGKYCSLALINGKPALSYFDETTDDLLYAYSSTADGAAPADWTIVTVDPQDGAGGAGTSLAVIEGKPAIAYGLRDPGSQQPTLHYAYSSQADGSSGWTTVVVDTDENAGDRPSLALVNGRPAISYTRRGSVSLFSQLRYAISSQSDGSSGWTKVLVVDPAIVGVGGNSSLAVVGGKPAISYTNTGGFSGVEYAYSDSADGALASDWHTIVIDSGMSIPTDSSLAVINGKPAVAYTTYSTDLTLTYVYSTTPLGQSESDWQSMEVDDSYNQTAVGYCSLAEVAGQPSIGYFFFNFDSEDLHYARPYTGI